MRLLRLARPQFLIAGILLYLFGALWAVLLGAPLAWPRLLLGYLIVMPAHLSVSFSNDYFDTEVDGYGTPSPFTGGSGILVQYPELRPTARRIAIGLIFCSLALGLLFMALHPEPTWFLALVLAGGLAGWFYSAPPLSLSYRGLGEITNALVGGLLVPALGYLVMAGSLTAEGLIFTIPLTLYGLAFIISVEIPDVEADLLGGKNTLVSRKGRRFGFVAVGLFMLAAAAYFVGLQGLRAGVYPVDFRVLILLSCVPLSTGILGAARRPVDKSAATRLVTIIVTSLIVFFVLADGYLIYQVRRTF
jgi:1,4-dihydroxy-2-naphthoate octaprenyltransferase